MLSCITYIKVSQNYCYFIDSGKFDFNLLYNLIAETFNENSKPQSFLRKEILIPKSPKYS